MINDNERKTYITIGSGRLLDIIVYVDDIKAYDGMVEEAPENIKRSLYSKVNVGSKVIYYAYSYLNPNIEY